MHFRKKKHNIFQNNYKRKPHSRYVKFYRNFLGSPLFNLQFFLIEKWYIHRQNVTIYLNNFKYNNTLRTDKFT